MDAQWFKSQIRNKRLTQEDVAAAIGRSRSIVSRIFNDDPDKRTAFSPEFAGPIAQLFGASKDEILLKAGIRDATEIPASGKLVHHPARTPDRAAGQMINQEIERVEIERIKSFPLQGDKSLIQFWDASGLRFQVTVPNTLLRQFRDELAAY